MNKIVQRIRREVFLVLLILFIGYANGLAQHTVTGTVEDAQTGNTMPGVNVIVKGTSVGAATNTNGQFSLNAPSPQDTLVFSFIGYVRKEISINGRSTINVSLEPQTISGQDVVVIGYGTTSKKDLTGSISSVTSNDWEATSISTPDEVLQGRMAGVRVNTASHEPGGGLSVRIRGTASLNAGGSPLYVIDGMPINTSIDTGPGDGRTYGSTHNPLNSIDPSSIASIDVLKDASAAAIYGSRAANGVVLITTKQGVKGTQRIDFKSTVGVQKISNKLDFMNAEQWAEQANEHADMLGLPHYYTDQQVSNFANNSTDWQEEAFRTALQQKYDLTFSGGTDKLTYMVNGSHSNSEGIVRGSEFQRYGSTIRIDATPIDHLSVGGSMMFTASDDHQLRTDTKGYGGVAGIVDLILEAPPTIPARDTTGLPVNMGNYALGGGLENPLIMTDDYKMLGNTLRIINNAHITYDITEGLSFTSRLGTDIYSYRYHEYFPIGSEAGGPGGSAAEHDTRSINFLTENTLTFEKEISDVHHINVLAGFTYQQNKNDRVGAGAVGFPSDFYTYNNLGLATSPTSPSSYASRWQLVSYLGRINYSYKDTYLLSASGRIDGSSKFGVNNKYGFFPSISLAWQMGNEQFIQELGLFSELKLRASYGETGNESIGTYNSLSTISTSIGNRGAVYWNGQQNPIAVPSGVANPDLSWEKTSGYNVGVDVGLFNQRLQLTANYYNKKTTDLLLEVPIPNQTGFSSVLKNTGSMENKGFELQVYSNNTSGSFNWNTNFNISFERNKVTSLAGADHIWDGWSGGGNISVHNKYTVRIEPGRPIGMFYGSIFEGVWQSQQEIDQVGTMPGARPGDIRYKDVNGDGVYNAEDDDVFLGNPNPDFSFGLKNTFNYKQWDLNVFIYGSYGNDIMNLTSEHYVLTGMGVSAERLNRWTPNNTNTDIPSAAASLPARLSSNMIEDGSFVRIQNVTLTYNLPVKVMQNIPLRSAKIGLAADNLAVITGYSGYDPEVNAFGASNTTQSMDRFAYPSARTFRLEINLGF